MMKESTIVQQIIAVAEGKSDIAICTQQMQAWNQSYIQSALQAVSQNTQEDLGEMLKRCRKMRKTIAGIPKTKNEVFVYECGIFNGTYKILEEINRIYMNQKDYRASLDLLERKHVCDILDYLYKNPNARHNSIAENTDIKPNYLSQLLQLLKKAGFVEREGKHKSTKYYLTRIGRQTYRAYTAERVKTEDYIDIMEGFKEIPYEKDYEKITDKRCFEKERFSESDKNGLKGEERYGYTKWKENFRINSAIAVKRDSMGRIGVG